MILIAVGVLVFFLAWGLAGIAFIPKPAFIFFIIQSSYPVLVFPCLLYCLIPLLFFFIRRALLHPIH